jgi:hypothetical protein
MNGPYWCAANLAGRRKSNCRHEDFQSSSFGIPVVNRRCQPEKGLVPILFGLPGFSVTSFPTFSGPTNHYKTITDTKIIYLGVLKNAL